MRKLTKYQMKKHLPFHKQRGYENISFEFDNHFYTNCYDCLLEVRGSRKTGKVWGPPPPSLIDGKWVFGKTSKWNNQEPFWKVELL